MAELPAPPTPTLTAIYSAYEARQGDGFREHLGASLAIDDLTPDFPPIRTPWVIDWLMEVGPTDPGAMGAVPISWATIGQWQHCMGLDLPPWLVRLLRRLSVEFVAETVRAREPDCPPPWTATSVLNRDEVSRKVTNAFRALMMSKEPST